MSTLAHTRSWTWLAAPLLAVALVCGAFVATEPATSEATELSELQAEVEASAEALEEAEALVEELEAQIAANEERIAQIEAELPEAQDDAAASMRTMYKIQQGSGSLIQLFFSAEDFNELITLIQYLSVIMGRNADAIEELLELQDELEATEAELTSALAEAEEARAEAEEALAEAQAARVALQAELEAEAEAEEAEREAAVAAAAAALAAAGEEDDDETDADDEASEDADATDDADDDEASEDAASADDATSADDDVSSDDATDADEEDDSDDATLTTESGNETTVEVPSSSSASAVDWTLSKDEFIAEWTARIDAYLSGSPLSGYGSVFAEAAWTYGVDPRFSPAISYVESSKGKYCYRSYNAWGWGGISYSSWEEAIWSHVKGLANGYGGTLTYAGAKKYCPSNPDHWYSTVLAEMEKI